MSNTVTKLDARAVLDVLREIVAEKGADFVYERPEYGSCSYFHDNEPGCIVGHVLARFGVTREEVGDNNEGCEVVTLTHRQPDLCPWEGNVAATLLNSAQYAQDSGKTWGEALALAEQTYANLTS